MKTWQNWGRICWIKSQLMCMVDNPPKEFHQLEPSKPSERRPEWTSSHQCTSWPFYPLDGLHFFIRCQMGFITIHFFLLLTTFFFLGFVLDHFSGPDLTHSYPAHLPTLISIAPILVPYLLSPTDTATLITNYPTNLTTVLTTYPTNLATLLIIYPTNLIIRFRVETHKLISKFFTNV